MRYSFSDIRIKSNSKCLDGSFSRPFNLLFSAPQMLEIVDKTVFEIMTMSNNLVLVADFKAIILCSVHST